ncbi:MAG: hypothetical protein WCK11_04285 [Candidatus Falkowbacteria bacterium]
MPNGHSPQHRGNDKGKGKQQGAGSTHSHVPSNQPIRVLTPREKRAAKKSACAALSVGGCHD